MIIDVLYIHDIDAYSEIVKFLDEENGRGTVRVIPLEERQRLSRV